MIKADPDSKRDLTAFKFEVITQKGDWKTAAAMTDEMLKLLEAKPDALNQLAWAICENPSKDRDLGIALKFALKANEFEEGKDPTILDTLARVYFEQANLDKAIETQKRAVEVVNANKIYDEELRVKLAKTLKQYEDAKKSK